MAIRIRAGLVGLGLVAVTSATATAQVTDGVEIGMDAAISFGFSDPSATNIAIPVPAIRAGFPVAERVTLEPSLGFSLFKVEDADAVTQLNLEVGGLYHFNPDYRRGVFVRPRLGFQWVDVGDASATQFAVGFGVGTKVPVTERLGGRLEAFYRHGFENDDFGGTDEIGVSAGVSLWTR